MTQGLREIVCFEHSTLKKKEFKKCCLSEKEKRDWVTTSILSLSLCVSLFQWSLGQLLCSAPVGMVHGSAQLSLQGSLLLYYCMSCYPRRSTDLSDCLSFLSYFFSPGEAWLLMASALVHSNSRTAETLAVIAWSFMTLLFIFSFLNKDKNTKHWLLEDRWLLVCSFSLYVESFGWHIKSFVLKKWV